MSALYCYVSYEGFIFEAVMSISLKLSQNLCYTGDLFFKTFPSREIFVSTTFHHASSFHYASKKILHYVQSAFPICQQSIESVEASRCSSAPAATTTTAPTTTAAPTYILQARGEIQHAPEMWISAA